MQNEVFSLKFKAMKNRKISLESGYWTADGITSPVELIDAFFDFAHLDSYRKVLSEMVSLMYKKEILRKEYPGQLFIFYLAFRSFLRACYRLQSKAHQWKVKADETPPEHSKLCLGSLTGEEYQNPFAVFEKAFTEKTLEEYDFFLCETVHLSLCPCPDASGEDMMTPYLNMTNMLDAAQLMRERGVEKIEKNL
ncbi:hypothetical protein FIC_00237 [Flavobacteriaceae bacterium 3519-10]|nr:hypothetical protein FIC_00237 [Flavobacteriaceae bacterium 3519-10]